MRQYPVFVPMGREHVAAVITLPDGDPRGLVGLFQGGGGAPKSHRHAIWRRTAEGLAEVGIASVRMDWCGVGDSTGEAHFAFDRLPVGEGFAVIDFARDAVGTKALGVAGNCMGARVGLQIALRMEDCQSVAMVMLKPLSRPRLKRAEGLVNEGSESNGDNAAKQAHGPRRERRPAARMLAKVPSLDSLARKIYWRTQWRRTAPLLKVVSAVRKQAEVLIMEDDAEKEKGRLQQALNALRREDHVGPFELKDLPGGAIRVFDNIERQQFVIDNLVDWFDRTMPKQPAEEAPRDPEAPAGVSLASAGDAGA
jgi:hypothetical protein